MNDLGIIAKMRPAAASRRVRGTGSMMEQRSGVWQLRAHCGRDERGRKIYSYKTFTGSKTQADRELRRFQHDTEERHINGIVERPTATTFGDVLDSWVESHVEKKATTTQERYVQIVRDFIRPKLGHYALNAAQGARTG